MCSSDLIASHKHTHTHTYCRSNSFIHKPVLSLDCNKVSEVMHLPPHGYRRFIYVHSNYTSSYMLRYRPMHSQTALFNLMLLNWSVLLTVLGNMAMQDRFEAEQHSILMCRTEATYSCVVMLCSSPNSLRCCREMK